MNQFPNLFLYTNLSFELLCHSHVRSSTD